MKRSGVLRCVANAAAVVVCLLCVFATQAAVERSDLARYDGALLDRIGGTITVAPNDVDSLSSTDPLRRAWQAFAEREGGRWQVYLDERTAMPTLVSGSGIAWVPGRGNALSGSEPITIERLERMAREFLAENQVLFASSGRETWVLDQKASNARRDDLFLLVFRQEIDGVQVENARFDFHVGHGNLVSFGSSNWGAVNLDGSAKLSAEQARQTVLRHIGFDGTETHVEEPMELTILALSAGNDPALGSWQGARGEGLNHRLIWRYGFSLPGDEQNWVGEVDAHTGEMVAFYDATHYAAIEGGVFPISGNGICSEGGCDFPFPMPFADFTEAGEATQTTDDFGAFECASAGSSYETNLTGPYVTIDEVCGAVSITGQCDTDLALGLRAGENCASVSGVGAGNTSAARTSFYQVNRVVAAARAYLPTLPFLNNPVVVNTNVNSTCNATWSGELNMYRAGNGCGNTGENQGVLVHEWGHGFDQNDGGGYDNTSEAYADTVALFMSRDGCIGPGFRVGGATCSGYGDSCLECTGVRDHDYTRRQANTPATPTGFIQNNCPTGSGPCGYAGHCVSYVINEAMLDLARLDLPAMGLDVDTGWQQAEKIWYSSREGSGGDIFTCSLPDSDSCAAGSWYQQMRVADDDDGDLSNGTPHAAAIFAAFDRHDIACGLATDPENQNSSSCPTLDQPVLSAVANAGGVDLSWDAIGNADNYTIFRGELGCDAMQVNIGTAAAPATTFNDDSVDPDFITYYRVRANAANPACSSLVSNCVALPEEAKLIKTAHTLDDSGANGDSSGILSPGETVKLPVSLFNYGILDATQVSGTLTSSDGTVRIGTAQATYSDIPQSTSLESNDPHFELTVLPEAQCGDTVTLTVEPASANASTTSAQIDLPMGILFKDFPQEQDSSIPQSTSEPVISTLDVPDSRIITELDVSISISVVRQSDIVVDLVSPAGTRVRLTDRSGGLNTRYDRDRQPDGPGTMADFIGEQLQGTWTLEVQDVVAGPFPNPGTLNRWELHASVDEPFDCTPLTCSDALPGALGGQITLTKNGSDIDFAWPAAADADGYNVLHDQDVQLGSIQLLTQTDAATTSATVAGAATPSPGTATYYQVRGTNTCNWEGP